MSRVIYSLSVKSASVCVKNTP